MKGVNIPILIASLLLSIMLWMVVYAQNMKPQTPIRFSARLEASGLAKDKLIVTDMVERVRFTAVGPEDKLGSVRDESLVAYVDLSNAQPGRRSYPVQVLGEGSSVDIATYISPKPIFTDVTIEPVVSKRVRVVVEGMGRLSDPNLVLTSQEVDPDEVEITGARSAVERAWRARARLDLSSVDSANAQAYAVALEVVDRSGKPIESTLVRSEPLFARISPQISVAPEEKKVLVMPQFVGRVPDGLVPAGYTWEPREVVVRGPSLALAALTRLPTAPIDLAELRRTSTVVRRLVLPRGVTLVDAPAEVSVRVTIRATEEPGDQVNPTGP